MYDIPKYFGLQETCDFLGLGRSTVLRLCQKKVHGFPAVKVGNRWQIDAKLLSAWKVNWFEGKFEI